MKSEFFADTVFWIGLIRKDDQFHSIILCWQKWLLKNGIQIVTTEVVFWEFLNACSGIRLRRLAVDSYLVCLKNPSVTVIPIKRKGLQSAIGMYQSRADKEWSLTDCHSFQQMRKRKLTDALTTNHHFQQAGFRALLLEEPPSP